MTANVNRKKAQPVASAWNPDWLIGSLLVVGVFIAYQPAWHAGFIWDDDTYVTNNPLLTAGGEAQRIFFSSHTRTAFLPLVLPPLPPQASLLGPRPLRCQPVTVCVSPALTALPLCV